MGVTSSFNSGKTYTKIASYTVSGSTTDSFTISNIPQGFTDLVIITNGSQTGGSNAAVRFNGDAGSNYSNTWLFGNGSSAGSGRALSQTQIIYNFVNTTDNRSMARLNIMNYSSNSVNKTMIWRRDDVFNATITQVGLWRNTAAITSITFLQTVGSSYFTSGTTFNIYGIKAAIAPKAIGGTITTDGSYWYHTFTSSGVFTPQQSINADVLVIAGGGGSQVTGSGGGPSGGGGAGGLLGFTSQSLQSNTPFTVTVGAGGANTTGSDSRFGSLTLVKGGGLGGGTDVQGSTGGSGGGSGGRFTSAGGSATSGQGNAGGKGAVQASLSAGGGGGATAPGADAPPAGNGGNGSSSYSSWGLATGTGQLSGGTYYYAGGGAGQSWYSGTNGTAGLGGGGAAGTSSGTGGAGSNGTANTGGGGGGGNLGSTGGSGIVIVRYPI